MAPNVSLVELNNGVKIPIVGLGTWQAPPDGTVYRAVKEAIANGYRHIDCAFIYGNEDDIGKAIAESISEGIVTRSDLFIVSKVWVTYYTQERVKKCLDLSLKKLGISYLDLYLVHWPVSFKQNDEQVFPLDENNLIIPGNVDFVDCWKGMEDVYKAGLVKAIGVSNFKIPQLERLLSVATVKPTMNQVECHPYLAQRKLIDFCHSKGIQLTAYSPLGNFGSTDPVHIVDEKKNLLEDPLVVNLAKKYNKGAGQVLLKFQVQRGICVIPKSVRKERIVSNLDLFDFELASEDLAALEALDCNYRVGRFNGHGIPNLVNYPFK